MQTSRGFNSSHSLKFSYIVSPARSSPRPPRRLTCQHRQDYGVQHDRHHHAAEQVAAVPVHQVPPDCPTPFMVLISRAHPGCVPRE